MIVTRAYLRLSGIVAQIVLPKRGVELGKGVRFHGFPLVSQARHSRIVIGSKCILASHSATTALGVRSQVILRTLAEGARIEIGAHCGLSGAVLCAHKRITIGDGTLLGADVMVFDTDFHPPDSLQRWNTPVDPQRNVREVVIGRNVFVGTRSIICKGVRIGDNAVIGAGSVVTNDIEANSVYAGNPAVKIRALRPE